MSPLQAKSTPSLRSYLQATTPMRAMVVSVAMAAQGAMPKVGRMLGAHAGGWRGQGEKQESPSQAHSFPALPFAGDNADAGDGGAGGDGGTGGDAEGGQSEGHMRWLRLPFPPTGMHG